MLVSVLIPTYKRLQLLKRAVEDVFAQSIPDWELVVSDDEVGEGDTWEWLKKIADKDQRIRIFKNEGPKHGQVFNVNNGLRHCRGEWIKVLFDDDRMLPCCIERMLAVARLVPSAVMIGCRAQKWRNGAHIGDEKDFANGAIDVIASADCSEAILKFDRWNGRTPTHMMINKVAINAGALMPENAPYKLPVDWVWFAEILRRGDYAMMKDILVCQCEGEVMSLTGGVRKDPRELDREMFLAYREIYNALPKEIIKQLPWNAVSAEINGVRGVYHLLCGELMLGITMILKMFRSLHAVSLVLRWLLQEAFPQYFAATKRASV